MHIPPEAGPRCWSAAVRREVTPCTRCRPTTAPASFRPTSSLPPSRRLAGRRTGAVRADQLLEPFCDLRQLPVDKQRPLTMSMTGGFTIDGKKFDHDRVDQVVELGALEEWTIVNDSVLMHPFHIHVNPFQLTHIDGCPVDEPELPRHGVDPAPRRQRHLPHECSRTSPARSLFHCHIVPHSDLGMMGMFEIVARGEAPRSGSEFVCRL